MRDFGLEKKFEVEITKDSNLISNQGNFSMVMKVRDEEGKIYAGKFPKFITKFDYIPRYDYYLDESFLEKVIESRLHENFIAEKIYKKFGYTLKPEGVFMVKLNEPEVYLPAFVNEYDEDYKTLDGIEDPLLKEVVTKERLFEVARDLFEEGFYPSEFDWKRHRNWLYSEEKDDLKVIDFGWWNYDGKTNPFPTLGLYL